MGIVNATPDSFSDGGRHFAPGAALAGALAQVGEGADFIDLGAESTRPGAAEIDAAEEWRRLEPVLAAFAGKVAVPVSVDTWKAEVAAKALAAGASIVNDVHGLQRDPEMAGVVASAGAGLVLMHNSRGETAGGDIIGRIRRFFEKSLALAERAGIAADRIVLDPGIGFGKSVAGNLAVLRRVGELRDLGLPLLLGASRKSVIGAVLDRPVEDRLEGTIATTVAAVIGGVDIVRVHDIDPNLKAARMADAIYRDPS
ncbi:MAG: dihydropteroate synthase [Puniceicoccaceae bacterium]